MDCLGFRRINDVAAAPAASNGGEGEEGATAAASGETGGALWNTVYYCYVSYGLFFSRRGKKKEKKEKKGLFQYVPSYNEMPPPFKGF